jgi:oligosaccharyltransferase complex subunit beta
LSPQSLYDFVEKGKNVLVVLSPDLSELWRDFSREFEVDFDERNNMVVDHFHYDQDLDNKSHTALVIPLSDALSPIVSALTRSGAPLLYRGVGHQVGRLPLLNSILSATSTAYSWEVKEADSPTEDVFIAGSSIGLVTALQAKNNARVTFIGSLEVFSNEFGLASVKSSEGMQYASPPFINRIYTDTSNQKIRPIWERCFHQRRDELDISGIGCNKSD